jgi:hypothetical protein
VLVENRRRTVRACARALELLWNLHSNRLNRYAIGIQSQPLKSSPLFLMLMLIGDDMRHKPFIECQAALSKLLFRSRDSTSNKLREPVTRCLLPFAISGLRELFQRSWSLGPIKNLEKEPLGAY